MYIIDVSVLFTGDTVDHNILTMEGKGTFHGMGIITALTPRKQLDIVDIVVPRTQIAELHVKEHAEIWKVDYQFSNHARQSVRILDLSKSPETGSRVDMLWELSLSFEEPTPNWSRMMHIIHQGHPHLWSSSIIFLPMIDMNSGDMACYKTPCPTVITFDQPLFWKT